MKIRYECSALIEELEEDGLFEMEDEEVAQIMKAKDVLAILKEQNRII